MEGLSTDPGLSTVKSRDMAFNENPVKMLYRPKGFVQRLSPFVLKLSFSRILVHRFPLYLVNFTASISWLPFWSVVRNENKRQIQIFVNPDCVFSYLPQAQTLQNGDMRHNHTAQEYLPCATKRLPINKPCSSLIRTHKNLFCLIPSILKSPKRFWSYPLEVKGNSHWKKQNKGSW